MARRAFLLGRNTGRLRHCAAYDEQGRLARSDLWLMHDCLGRVLGFDQVEVAPGDAAYQEILAQLGAVTHACTAQDTFVFYFAGHSWGSDGLQLVIAEDYRERQNWMPARQIVAFIKDCPALCKLIILDSCEAGKAAEGLLPDPGCNVRVLTATDGVLNAQERTPLAAGVFTFHLHKALTDEALRHAGANGVLDEDGNLCLERIHRWLRAQVPGYAKDGEPRIPEPQLYGGVGREIYFAKGLTPCLRRPFAPDELAALLALLADAQLTPEQLDEEYEDVLAKSGLRGGHYREPAPRLAESGLDAAIGFLARAGKMSGVDVAVPVPLLELVARLAHLAENGEALRQWLRDSAENLRDKEFTQANIAALGYTRETPRQLLQARYLLIAFEPIDRNARMVCTAEAWLVDAQGNGGKVAKRPEVTADRFAAFIDEALGHKRVQDHLRGASERLPIELMLPVVLLDAEHDDWTPDGCDSPLSTQYPLVVRPIERSPGFSTPRYTAGWGAGWHCCEPCRAAPSVARCTSRLDAPPPEGFLELLEDGGMCLFVLRYRPQEADLRDLLEDGVAMALWAPKPLPESVCERLRLHLEENPLDTLPDAVRKIRYRQWRRARTGADTARGAGARLLWDDPARVPKRPGKEDETGRVRRLRNPMRPT